MLKKILYFSFTISIIHSFNLFPLSIQENRIVISKLKDNEIEQALIKCFYISKNYNVYDLTNMKYPMIKKGEYTEKLNNGDYSLYFNFCGDTNIKCGNTTGQAIAKNAEKCKLEAGKMEKGNQWKDLSSLNQSLLGVQILLNSGQKCEQNETLSRKMKFTIQCDNSTKDIYKNESRPYQIISKNYNPESCENEIIFKSYYACPSINLASIWAKLEEMKYIPTIVLIVCGVFLLFLGKKFEQFTISLLVFLTSLIVLFVVIFAFMPSGGNRDIIFWTTVFISIVISGVISYFFWENTNLLIEIICGFLGGYLLGTFIYSLLILKIKDNIFINIVVIIVCMVIVFVITHFTLDYILIIITSIIGAYAIMRASTFWIGDYPNETQLINLISKGEKDEIKKLITFKFYIYIVTWILLTIGGIVFQIKKLEKKEKISISNDPALYTSLENDKN
jgi:hypothetical protein